MLVARGEIDDVVGGRFAFDQHRDVVRPGRHLELLRRRAFIDVVDEDVRESRPQLVPVQLGLDHGPPDEVGVVGGALGVEVLEVLLEEPPGSDELRQVVLVAQPLEGFAVEPLLPRPTQDRGDLVGEPPRLGGAPERGRPDDRLGRLGQQLAEHDVLLRRGEQVQRSGVQLGRAVAAHEAVGEGVEGGAHRRGGRAAQAGGDPVAQLLGRLAAEGQRQHRLRGRPPPLDAVDDGLDQGRRLARAGAGQHEQRAARVVDHSLLGSVEGRRPGRSGGTHELVARPRHVGRGCWCHRDSQTPSTDMWQRRGRVSSARAPGMPLHFSRAPVTAASRPP